MSHRTRCPEGGDGSRRRGTRRRMTGDQRERAILEAAAEVFAEEGFNAPLRQLAKRMNVTPSLLYRYFPTKDRLIEQVIQHLLLDLWDDRCLTELTDSGAPLEKRLIKYYDAYLRPRGRNYFRVFTRGSLHGYGFGQRVDRFLTEYVLAPVVAELRREAKLPDFREQPLMRGERELAMVLHGQVSFLMLRFHIFGIAPPDDFEAILEAQVRIFLGGALQELRRIHSLPETHSFRVQHLP